MGGHGHVIRELVARVDQLSGLGLHAREVAGAKKKRRVSTLSAAESSATLLQALDPGRFLLLTLHFALAFGAGGFGTVAAVLGLF